MNHATTHGISQADRAEPSTGSRRGGYQIRVPDPQAWKLEMLKDGDHGFVKWRESFEIQVNSVWIGFDVMLEEIRSHTMKDKIIDEDEYNILLRKHNLYPVNGQLDWDYKYLSTKIYMVLFTYCGMDPIKIMKEANKKCGLEAYRLLNRAYDAYAADNEVTLLNNILQI